MDGLELAKQLVRTVTRAFYETEHVVLIDALVNHSALSLPDLALVMDMGKQLKAAQKVSGKLREGGLISVFGRSEIREGAQKAVTREYYYIDYRRAVDATKYRIQMLDEKIKSESRPTTEKKEYECPQCHSQWTTLELMSNAVPYGTGFLCNLCGHMCNPIDEEKADEQNDNTPAKFNKQFSTFLNLLQKIDHTTVPEITGEQALAAAVPLPRDERLNPMAKSEPVSVPTVRPTAVKGMAVGTEKIEVTLTTNSETTAAEAAAEVERRARLAAQNQLPSWHTHSTIDNADYGKGGVNRGIENSTTLLKSEEEQEDKKVVDPVMEDYWAQMAADKEREQREREEEEEEDDDEEEDEFEDVVVPEADDAPESKRMKLEEPAEPAVAPATAPAPAPATNEADAAAEESEEDEFEDAI